MHFPHQRADRAGGPSPLAHTLHQQIDRSIGIAIVMAPTFRARPLPHIQPHSNVASAFHSVFIGANTVWMCCVVTHACCEERSRSALASQDEENLPPDARLSLRASTLMAGAHASCAMS
jgi:hypothetical protein